MAVELATIKLRKAELERLGKLAPEELKTHTSTLAAMIEHTDAHVRTLVMEALSKLSHEDLALHTAAITGRLEDAKGSVRAAAVTSVGKLARADPATHTATLAAKLEDAESYVCSKAICALHELSPEYLAPHAAAIAAKLDDDRFSHGDDGTWCLVLRTLGKLAPHDLAPHTAAFRAELREIQQDVSVQDFLKRAEVQDGLDSSAIYEQRRMISRWNLSRGIKAQQQLAYAEARKVAETAKLRNRGHDLW